MTFYGRRECPLHPGVYCAAHVDLRLPKESRCLGCPNINDVDRDMVIYEIRRERATA